MDIDGMLVDYVQIDDRQLAEVVRDNYKPEDIFDAADLKLCVSTMFSPEEVFPRATLEEWCESHKVPEEAPGKALRVKQRDALLELFLANGGKRVQNGYKTDHGFFSDEMFSRCGRTPAEPWTWADEWLEEDEGDKD